MPNTANFGTGIVVGNGIAVRSVRYWCYASSADLDAANPQVGSNAVTPNEVPLQQAHVVCWDMYSAPNQGGTYFGRGIWGNSAATVAQQFAGMTADQILAAIYPPPGTDT